MYIVEGNIGAGKSTFLKLLNQHAQLDISLEPLHNWQKKMYGSSLLEHFYQDPKRWAYSFETFAMICRVQEHIREQNERNPYRLLERSIYSGHYCFALSGYENGFMSESEWDIYTNWFEFLIPQRCNPPRGFIYLNISPEAAYQRIKKRNRIEEQGITLSYLNQLHTYHERFLILKKNILPSLQEVPVLVLDVEQDFQENKDALDLHIDKVLSFIKK